MLKEKEKTLEIDESDIAAALQNFNSSAFKSRFIRTDYNAPDPDWKVDGLPVEYHVNGLVGKFKNEVEGLNYRNLYGGVFQKFDTNTVITIAHHHTHKPVIPTPRDLFHVYGPDRDDTKDYSRYYAYAWKDEGPHAIIYSDNNQIIRQGLLSCSSYCYSGQNSYAIVGAGLFFRPQFGPSKISIRPYVQWSTYASFTGVTGPSASAKANIGIYVESWKPGSSELINEKDIWIPVWAQNTQQYIVGNTAGGSATVSDGLATEINVIPERKYAIYVYIWVETEAGPQQQKNEYRFVRLDMDATVPYVVVEEKLL